MPKTYKISQEEVEEIERIRKTVKDKTVDKRLQAIELRGKGEKNTAIGKKLDKSPKLISRWVSAYCSGGIQALMGGKYGGNRRNMSMSEETAFMEKFKEEAAQGKIIEVKAIKSAYEEKVGHSIGGGQIYRVLSRQGWRKIMPRSKHPSKASEEAIEASKKLTML